MRAGRIGASVIGIITIVWPVLQPAVAQAPVPIPPPSSNPLTVPPPPPPLPSGASSATPRGNPSEWITPDDYPTVAWVSHLEGVVGFQLLVDPRGKVVRCTVTESSGYVSLDQTACNLLSVRASFDPAHDMRGKAVPGTYRNRVRWVMPEAELGDYALVSEAGDIRLTKVIFRFVVEEDGSTSDCTVESEGLVTKPEKPFGPCLAEPTYQPFTDAKGKAVRKRVTYTVSASAVDVPKR